MIARHASLPFVALHDMGNVSSAIDGSEQITSSTLKSTPLAKSSTIERVGPSSDR